MRTCYGIEDTGNKGICHVTRWTLIYDICKNIIDGRDKNMTINVCRFHGYEKLLTSYIDIKIISWLSLMSIDRNDIKLNITSLSLM